MPKRIYFTTKNIHGVIPGTDGYIRAVRDSCEFITSCKFNTDIKVGSGRCRQCEFYRGSDMFNKEISRCLVTDFNGREVGILIRRSYVSCAYKKDQNEQAAVISNHVDSIKSIW